VVHADLKNSALAHLSSGRFTANAAWPVLAVIAFNLTRDWPWKRAWNMLFDRLFRRSQPLIV
jgi:hypothetical protein